MASIHELARKALDERWIPIRDAKTCKETRNIRDHTTCCFCDRNKEIIGDESLTTSCYISGCPLASKNMLCAKGKYRTFSCNLKSGEFSRAHAAAVDICNQLQALLDAPDYEW